jgi:hypothetical protein
VCFPDKHTYPVIGIDGDSSQGDEECSPQNVPHCSPLPQKPGNECQQGIVPETETILPSRLFLLTTSVGFPHSLPILSKRAGFKGLLVGEKETCYNTFSYQYPAGGGSLPRWKGIRWTWRISDKSGISCGNTAPLRERERFSEPPGVCHLPEPCHEPAPLALLRRREGPRYRAPSGRHTVHPEPAA